MGVSWDRMVVDSLHRLNDAPEDARHFWWFHTTEDRLAISGRLSTSFRDVNAVQGDAVFTSGRRGEGCGLPLAASRDHSNTGVRGSDRHTHTHTHTHASTGIVSHAETCPRSLTLSLSLCLSLYLPPLLRTTLLRAPCFDEPKFCWQDYTSLKAGSLFCTRIRCRIICHSSSPLIRCACESQWLREDLLAQNVHKKSSTHSADPSHGSADRMSPKSMLQGTSANQGSGTSALIQQETWLAVLSSGPIKTAESITVRFPQI